LRQTVYGLIELQEVDNRLDELMEERGDLPLIVEDLQSKIQVKKDELNKGQQELKEKRIRQRELELQIEEAKGKLEKYEEQLYQVKTNKEYDAITAETESAKEILTNGKKELDEIAVLISENEEEISRYEGELSALEEELETNKVELKSKMSATSEEEGLLMQERDIILKKTAPGVVKMYEMVRSARDGQGVASVESNVCGGCFSQIPPQKIVEIKKMKKVYTCEYCGRILVWDESQA